MKKQALTIVLNLFIVFSYAQSMSDSLEIAYKNNDTQLLDWFFKNWEVASKSLNDSSFNHLPEIDKDIYEIYEDLYTLSQLKCVDGMNDELRHVDLIQAIMSTPFAIIMDKPYDAVAKRFVISDVVYYKIFETLDIKELIIKHLKRENLSDTNYRLGLGYLLKDTAEISIPRYYEDDMVLIKKDSIFSFRPRINIKGTEVLSLSKEYEALIQDYFNDKDSIIDYEGYKYQKLKVDWENRKKFIEQYIDVRRWNLNFWVILSNPSCCRILFDKNLQIAMFLYRVNSSGGVILYKKINNSWKYISSHNYILFD